MSHPCCLLAGVSGLCQLWFTVTRGFPQDSAGLCQGTLLTLVLALIPTHDVNASTAGARDTAQYLRCPLRWEQCPSLAGAALD